MDVNQTTVRVRKRTQIIQVLSWSVVGLLSAINFGWTSSLSASADFRHEHTLSCYRSRTGAMIAWRSLESTDALFSQYTSSPLEASTALPQPVVATAGSIQDTERPRKNQIPGGEKGPLEMTDVEIQRAAMDAMRDKPDHAAKFAIARLEREPAPEPKIAASLNWIAGTCLALTYKPEQAMPYLEEAERLSREIADERLLRRTLRYKSAVAFDLGQYPEGSQAAAEALEISAKMKDTTDYVALLHNEMALNESKRGNIESAIEHFKSALQICEAGSNIKLHIMVMTNLGSFYSEIGRLDSAAAIHEQTQILARKNNVQLVECVAYLNLAESLQRLQKFSEARSALDSAGLLVGKPGQEHLRSRYDQLVSLQQELERVVAQKAIAAQAPTANADQPAVPDDAELPVKRLLSEQDFRRTIDYWQQQLDGAKQREDFEVSVGICRSMADLAKQHEQWPLATKYLEELNSLETRRWRAGDGINAFFVEEHLAGLKAKQTENEIRSLAQVQLLRTNYYRSMAWFALIALVLTAGCAALFWFNLRSKRRMVAELQRASEEIRHQKESQLAIERRLLERQKSESLSMMAAGIAHDFNNLLTGIVGLAETGRLEQGENSKDRFFRQIVHASMRASDLTMQLRQYLGERNHANAVIDLTSNLESMWGLLVSLVRNRAMIDFHGGDQSLLAQIDEVGFQQIVINLVANAAEASPVSSTIEVVLGRRRLQTRELVGLLHHKDMQPGEYCFVNVTDHGQGMDETTLGRMFDPYFSTKGDGRGLGMASLLGIVRSCGGGIHVTTSRHSGTSITVYIPATQVHLETAADRQLSNPETAIAIAQNTGEAYTHLGRDGKLPTDKKGYILLVDDEHVVRESVEMVLNLSGYRVLTADCVANALATIEEFGGQISCIVSDYSMPDCTGVELAEKARQLLPQVPFILCSGYADQDLSLPPAGVVILHKPFLPDHLLASIANSIAECNQRVGHESE